MKETERYLSSMLKHFDGKETEANWEAREQTIIRLREIVQSTNIPEEKNSLGRLIRSYGDAIGQSVQSLRTTLALSALGLVEDIGTHLGNDLDPFTTDLLFIRMLRCASTLKKIIAKHSMDACTSYLSNIPYRNRIMQQITESMGEKNIQLRHHATIYLKTILETHAASVAIEKSGGLDLAEKAIKKALSDASPMVRESCRKLFSVLQTYWPGRASRLLQSLDSNVQKSLDKITNTKPIMKRPSSYRSSISSVSSFSTVSTVSTCSSWSSASTTSSISSSRPSIRSRLYSQPTLRTNSTLSHLPSSQNSFNVPSPSRSSIASSSSSHTRSAKLASLPPPMRRVPRKRVHEEEQDDVKLKAQRQTNDIISNVDKNTNSNNNSSNSSNRNSNTVMDYEQEEQYSSSHLAKATLLQMLKSADVDSNCRAIRRLSKKLKGLSNPYQNSYILPNDVPSSTDLQPILIKYMSYETDNSIFWKTLMSWDCLVAVYTRMIHIQHYIPALILVSQRYNNRVFSQQQRSSIIKTCQIGLRRLRSYLTSYDPELPKHLLQVLDKVSVVYSQDSQQRDAIILYIIEWMDEIVCEYVGLGMDDEEQDNSMILQVKEGSDYYFEQDGHPAYPWFDDETNMRQVISRVLSMLETAREEDCGGEEDEDHETMLYKTLKTLASRLRLSNERVFDPYTERFEVAIKTPPRRSNNKNTSNDNSPLMGQDWKFDDDTIDAIPDDEGEDSEGVESTGATQEFSKMDLQVNVSYNILF
ncbi:clasp N terminal-domain-containing protein [Circinella umbellata]|nr:clasp N terminal-domain-containing protein [Circinella umbellata]